ncbi:MAG TPA: outer membrane beta-barrel protein [Polyangiaceae bacterium]|nr:outer membrane beta-barrel protein [Polyangiaceae bacterium]
MKTAVNHRVLGRALCAFGTLTLVSMSKPAHAIEVGAGLMGIAGGNFQSKPDRSNLDPDVNPGFGGLTIGGGLMLDARFLNMIGLEVDIIRSSDHGKGTYTINGQENKITIGQGAWHIPILAKLTFPSPLVAPAIFLGPEIVAPSKAGVSVDPSVAQLGFAQTSDTYVMFTFGAGVEIKLPLPVIDLRIPIGIRGSYAPGVDSSFSKRTTLSAGAPFVTYRSEWQYAVNATLGAAIYF